MISACLRVTALAFRPILAPLYPLPGKARLQPKWRILVHISYLHGMVNPAQFKETALVNQRYFYALKHSNLIGGTHAVVEELSFSL
jgi:hypothetical protein